MRARRAPALAGLALALGLLGFAAAAQEPAEAPSQESQEPDAAAPESTAYEEYDDLYFDEAEEEDHDGDPLEPMNRGVFWFNDGLDRYVLEPVSKVWDRVLPDFVQRALRNAFGNLDFPIVFFNHLFQLKPLDAGKDLSRFVLNTTVGIGGLMDPASTIGLRRLDEDFGQTLGYWGVPAGPYLMLPFFGPSSIRDGFGLIVDTAFRAIGFFIPFWASASMTAVDTLNRRSLIRDAIEAERRAALDWYAAVRSAYTQYRASLVKDTREGAETEYGFYPSIEKDEAEPQQ